MKEKTKKYYLGVLSDSSKDMFEIRRKLLRNNEDLELIKEFVHNEHFIDYEIYAVSRLEETIDIIFDCCLLLDGIENNIDEFVDLLEDELKGEKDYD